MTENKHFYDLILNNTIFSSCSESLLLCEPLSNAKKCVLKTGEELFSTVGQPCVGILISGRAAIYSSDPAKRVLMRFVFPGEAVGVASLFATKEPRTRIVACSDSDASFLILTRSDFEILFSSDNGDIIRNNILSFLADRISFLNRRIACVTGGSAERKLSIFLVSAAEATSKLDFDIGMSMKSLAAALDIGRASLYRAVDSLVNEGIIERHGARITILDKERLISSLK